MRVTENLEEEEEEGDGEGFEPKKARRGKA